MKTIRRDWLKKQIENGKAEAKCDIHLTDDYVFDNAYGFGKTEWLPCRISKPVYEHIILENGAEIDMCVDSDHKDGYINLRSYHFDSGSKASDNGDGTINLKVHSNLYYTIRLKD